MEAQFAGYGVGRQRQPLQPLQVEEQQLLRLEEIAVQGHVGAGQSAPGGKAAVMGGDGKRLQGVRGQGLDGMARDGFYAAQPLP